MTTIYFVRHSEPNYENHIDLTRELTPVGLERCKLVNEFLEDKGVEVVFSSPLKRAIDTIQDFAVRHKLEINVIDDFRERSMSDVWIENIGDYFSRQWSDFDYRMPGGESLRDTQERNIRAVKTILLQNSGKTMIVGSHGTALSTIINYYNKGFGVEDFIRIKNKMPWIVEFNFDDEGELINYQEHDLY